VSLTDIIEEKYVKANGIKFHVVTAGEGAPLMCLHGFPDFWYGWKNIILGLYKEFNLIVPDLRGYNLSDKPEGVNNYKLDILLQDIRGLAQSLNLGKFNLVGHDWGGAISWAFAFQYPDVLNKLMIINAPHPQIFSKQIRGNKKQRRSSGYIFEMLKPGGEQAFIRNDYQLLQFAVFGNVGKKNAFSEEDKKKYQQAWSQPGAILGGVNYYRANTDMADSAGLIKVPTLVIHGMKDKYVRAGVLEGLEQVVEDLQIVKVEDASHWVMHDAPQKVINSIKKFMK